MAAVDTLLHDNLHTRLPYARPPPARQARPLEPRPLIPRRAYACDAAPPFPLPAPPCPPPAASANCVSVLRGEAAPALAHARGPAMRTVALRAVEPDGCPLLHELPLPHRVRQLAAGEPSAADCTLAARTEARVHFLSHRPAERALRAGPLLSPAAPPLHLALNPSLRGEAACLLASLELHTYDLARLPPDERPAPPPAHRLALAPAAAPSAGGAVEFGAHPRTLYTLTDGAVRLIDLRQPPPPPEARRLLFDARRLPLADGAWDVLAVPRGEHGSPLLSLCSHGHLLLLDARSARAPVLQWRLPIPLCAEAAALSPRSFVEFCGAASIHLTERSSAACLCFEFGGGRGSGALPLPAPQMPTSLDARRSLFQHLVYGDVCADVPSFPLAGAAAFELGDGGGVELGVLSCGGALLRLSRAERGGGGGGGGARLADAANGAWEAPQRDELGVDAVASRRLWEEVWRRPVVEEGANDEAAAAAGVLAVTASEAAVDEQMVAALRGKWDAWQQSDFSELAVVPTLSSLGAINARTGKAKASLSRATLAAAAGTAEARQPALRGEGRSGSLGAPVGGTPTQSVMREGGSQKEAELDGSQPLPCESDARPPPGSAPHPKKRNGSFQTALPKVDGVTPFAAWDARPRQGQKIRRKSAGF